LAIIRAPRFILGFISDGVCSRHEPGTFVHYGHSHFSGTIPETYKVGYWANGALFAADGEPWINADMPAAVVSYDGNGNYGEEMIRRGNVRIIRRGSPDQRGLSELTIPD
jgi:hypothetical protein